ncbi:type IV secretion system protein VirD4 [Spirosomataceae bacterium TFI 002]|nr:type IV secretion system protein VirD4 [Spirosomataceae bacterium TFI 002]
MSNEILMGYSHSNFQQIVGFKSNKTKKASPIPEELLTFDGRAHIITIAPTGAGKGIGTVQPNILNYEGPLITLDPKGEQVLTCKKAREKIGHKVVVLDPFQVTHFKSDHFNVMDIKHLSNFDADDDSFTLAHQLVGQSLTHDPFWDNHAKNLLGALINYHLTCKSPKDQHLGKIRGMLGKDLSYQCALILEKESKISNALRDALAGFLSLQDPKTQSSVEGTAVQAFSSLFSNRIENFLSKSTFDLRDIVDGKPVDIFIVFPPDKLKSHNRLLKLIFAVLFKAITSRTEIPSTRTLFILDECASLERFEYLENMLALARGYGLIIHTIWQDISQIKQHYGNGFLSILNNSLVWQFFGADKYNTAKEISDITGIGVAEILNLKDDEQLLIMGKKVHFPAKKLNYLTDAIFAGKASPNPFYKNFQH